MHKHFSVFGSRFSENRKPKTEYRKGGLHTFEAIVAFLIILSFIIFIMPTIKKEDTTSMTRNYVYASLGALEESGRLAELAMAENISGISVELGRTIPLPLKFAVGLSKQSAASGTAYPKELQPAYINFTAGTGTTDSAILELEYTNATGPAVYLNGNQTAYHAGDYSGRSEILDIRSGIVPGQNSVMLNTSNDATIGYSLQLINSIEPETLPQNKTINTVSYVVSGGSNLFRPAEVRVYVWK